MFGLDPGNSAIGSATQGALGGASTASSRQSQLFGPEASFINSLMQTQPGQLSQYAKAQYGANVRQNAQNAANARMQGLKGIGYSGRGGPGGATSSLNNAALQEQQRQDTGAYNQAQQQTYQGGVTGAGLASGLQSIYNPNQYYQTAIQGGSAQNAGVLGALGGVMGGLGSIGGAMAGI